MYKIIPKGYIDVLVVKIILIGYNIWGIFLTIVPIGYII